MTAPDLTTNNNPDLTTKLKDPLQQYKQQMFNYPGAAKDGSEMTSQDYTDLIDRRTGKSRIFSVQTPGEKIQQAQGPQGSMSLLGGYKPF